MDGSHCVLYLLRVTLADRPGALGALASAIAEGGGDITAVDVVERSGSVAVDDVLVDAADAASADSILSHVSAVQAVTVEAWQPFSEGDQLRDGLDVVDGLGATASRALAAIVRMAPAVVRAHWVVIIDDVNRGVAITQASAGAPWVRWAALPWLPLGSADRIDADPSWLPHDWGAGPELAAAPIGDSSMVLLAVRPNGPRFRQGEIARLANLAAVAALAAHSVVRSGIAFGGRAVPVGGLPSPVA
jgi:hypothetical protein